MNRDGQQHIIKRQVFELEISDRLDHAAVEQQVQRIQTEQLQGKVQELCDQLVGPETNLFIDRLELELPELAHEKLSDELVVKFEAQFKEQVAKLLQAQRTQTAVAPVTESSRTSDWKLVLEHFLTSGTLPWWASEVTLKDLDAALLGWTQKPDSAFRSKLLLLLQKHHARNRLVYRFSDRELTRIHAAIHSNDSRMQTSLNALLTLDPLPKTMAIQQRWRTAVWSSVFRHGTAVSGSSLSLQNVVHSALTEVSRSLDSVQHTLVVNLSKLLAGSNSQLPLEVGNALRSWVQQTVKELPKNDSISTVKNSKTSQSATDKGFETTSKIDGNKPGARSKTSANADSAVNSDEDDSVPMETNSPPDRSSRQWKQHIVERWSGSEFADEELYLNNAGLVLLAVYLPRFFEALNLLSERQFASEAAAHKAVHLLHYIATGTQEASEPEFVLNKLLCGLDVLDAVPETIELTTAETDACDQLLKAVIHNWKAVGTISEAGFRGSFLVREGRLTASNMGWTLRVDQKGWDILLDKLPWTYSMVKLNWMNQPIVVEW